MQYEETGCFDPNNTVSEGADDGFCQTLPPPPPPPPPQPLPPLMAAGSTTNSHNNNNNNSSCFEDNIKLSPEELYYQLQSQQGFNTTHLIQDSQYHHEQSINNWDPTSTTVQEIHDMNFNHHQLHQVDVQNTTTNNNNSNNFSPTQTPTPTPDLLNFFHLSRCSGSSASSLLPNSTISFTNPSHKTSLGLMGDLPMADTASSSGVLYDPLFHLNLPPQPPIFRDLFQSLPPHGFTLPAGASLFSGGGNEHGEASGGLYQDGDVTQQFDNGILEFTNCIGKGRKAGGKVTKHFVTEHQRRKHMNDKFQVLKNLIPNPTKTDRASMVKDTIEYIKELLRTVSELKLLVEKKRCGRVRSKRHKTGEDATEDVEACSMTPLVGDSNQSYNGSLRSSWLQRKFKDTEVDVRIIEDEVTIKLIQRKKINCLLVVSKILDELQLDIHHVAGGHIGDHYNFLFNTKIYEGSCVYASAIANRLIDVMDKQYASPSPTSGY